MRTFSSGVRVVKALALLQLHTLVNLLLSSFNLLPWVPRSLTLVHQTIYLVIVLSSLPFLHLAIYLPLPLPMVPQPKLKELTPHILYTSLTILFVIYIPDCPFAFCLLSHSRLLKFMLLYRNGFRDEQLESDVISLPYTISLCRHLCVHLSSLHWLFMPSWDILVCARQYQSPSYLSVVRVILPATIRSLLNHPQMFSPTNFTHKMFSSQWKGCVRDRTLTSDEAKLMYISRG